MSCLPRPYCTFFFFSSRIIRSGGGGGGGGEGGGLAFVYMCSAYIQYKRVLALHGV